MLRTWIEPQAVDIPQDYQQTIGGNPLVSKVLYSRGITELDSARGFLFPEDYRATPASELPGVEIISRLLAKAIDDRILIGVWGDFDVDGQTATTLFVSALRQLGANVVYHIPVRATESHGIALPVLKSFLERGVDLILTCDTGITSHQAVDFAHMRGVSVLITDHHDLPDRLPDADAIVNPKLLPAGHPLGTLPGVGVAYKVMQGLFQHQGRDESLTEYLDLVSLGIVADIALLFGDSRFLLQRGLESLRSTRRLGLLSMMELAELNQANLTEEHIGYFLAPRMNAVGRLDDANQMVELLMTADISRARLLALELEGMNAQRKLLTDQVYQAAQSMLSQDPSLLEFPVLVLSHPAWPSGVVGVVASRLVEEYHRPAILLSAPPGEAARGSARSIEAVNITAAIAANQDMLNGFGGHPMAAGLSIAPERIPEFRKAISRTIQDLGVELVIEENLQVDGYVTLPELSLDLVEDLERLAPFGAGNPPLVLATRNLKLTGYAAVGRNDEHLQLTIEDELGHSMRSIWWQGAGYPLPEIPFDLAYSVRASTYRGQRDVQVEWVDYRPVEGITIKGEIPTLEVVDYRTIPDPLAVMQRTQAGEKLAIWGEVNPYPEVACYDRDAIPPSSILAIWTIPPGQDEIQSVLQKVKPGKVYLFGINPGVDEPDAFLKRLLGLIKYRIKSFSGSASLPMLAAAMAQKVSTIVAGLEWLEKHGHIHIQSWQASELRAEAGSKKEAKDAVGSSARLNAALAESAAFRRYYLKADKDRLLIYE
ncbi:MAG: single-stranded-DNA-specific exonuclease RecJ [Acidobacteriaceae bacterium]